MSNTTHKKKGEDAICGSDSRQITSFDNHVTCDSCKKITKYLAQSNHVKHPQIHQQVSSRKIKEMRLQKEVENDKMNSNPEIRFEDTVLSKYDKMLIETGVFFIGLCKGLEKPSRYEYMPINDFDVVGAYSNYPSKYVSG